jgi:hypothetical protein
MFRLFVPANFGGHEVDPITFVKVIEEISAVDGSSGWVVSVCAVGGLLAGYLGEEVAMAIHGENPHAIIAGSVNPTGKAVTVDGGYLVGGRWAFGSGIRHANWVYGNCVIFDGERRRLDTTGKPETRLMLFPVTACAIHDGTLQVCEAQAVMTSAFQVCLFHPDGRWLLSPDRHASQGYCSSFRSAYLQF